MDRAISIRRLPRDLVLGARGVNGHRRMEIRRSPTFARLRFSKRKGRAVGSEMNGGDRSALETVRTAHRCGSFDRDLTAEIERTIGGSECHRESGPFTENPTAGVNLGLYHLK